MNTMKFDALRWPCASDAASAPTGKDISCEIWREYQFGDTTYRIDNPVALYFGATTHRVLDVEGIVHQVPAPGHHGCVIRWRPADPQRPVQF